MDPKHTNQVAGNLGFINTMQEQLLQHKAAKQQAQQPTQAPQKPQNAPQQEQEPKGVQDNPKEEKKENVSERITEMELSLSKKIDDLHNELKTDLEGLKK